MIGKTLPYGHFIHDDIGNFYFTPGINAFPKLKTKHNNNNNNNNNWVMLVR